MRTALTEGPKIGKVWEQSDALIPSIGCGPCGTLLTHIREDIRAAPMLLLRMFETPHRTVAWFRRHQSGAKK